MDIDVRISGLGAVCAAGRNVPECMSALRAGTRPQAGPDFLRPQWDFGELPDNPVCAVSDGLFEDGWRRGSTRDSSRLLLQAAEEALACAKLAALPPRIGICVGTTAGCALHFLGDYRKLLQCPENACRYPSIDDFYASSMAADLLGLLESRAGHGFTGPVLTISNACTSGADAIAMAAEWIRLGLCDIALAGGTDALSVVPYIGFNKLMIYSPEPCRPFDVRRNGLNLGEGAGVLVLESAAHAEKRAAPCQGLLKGWGAAGDAYHMTAPHPEGRGLRRAIEQALGMARAVPGDIAFINAHGTSTPENDKIESLIYGELFSRSLLWASKGVTGHCLGAAGALEAVFSLRALAGGSVPASAGCETPEKDVENMLTRRESAFEKDLALSVSLGFGGSNAALVFGKAE